MTFTLLIFISLPEKAAFVRKEILCFPTGLPHGDGGVTLHSL